MKRRSSLSLIALCLAFLTYTSTALSCGGRTESTPTNEAVSDTVAAAVDVRVGAECMGQYLPLLRGQRVALLSNHTGMLADGRHTLDALLDSGVDVRTIFSPEHGFRGTADAGEHVAGGRDAKTGIPIASLYDGSGKREPSSEVMDSLDVLVVDIQDVGLRFYTYYCTMIDLINACGSRGKRVVILDRPNPNGMTVDGPVLDMKYASGVGRLPIPTVHGLTLGELALMARGEGWLRGGIQPGIDVVECENYTHSTRYELPIAPSPNLKTQRAIYLYPSMCYFEATPVSLGRGTDHPFEVYGHPSIKPDSDHTYRFIPRSMDGAKNPPQLGKECIGRSLIAAPPTDEDIIAAGVNLEYLIDAYRSVDADTRASFFNNFFEKLMGNGDVRTMIEQGMSAEEIKASWHDEVEAFKELRSKYLLYDL